MTTSTTEDPSTNDRARHPAVHRPALLTFMMRFFFCLTALLAVALPIILLSTGGEISFGGQTDHTLFSGLTSMAIYIGAIAYALYKRLRWSRFLLAAYFPVCGALGILSVERASRGESQAMPAGFITTFASEFVVISIIALWYLYRKPAVVAYYAAITKEDL